MLRDDILVSVCVHDIVPTRPVVETLTDLAKILGGAFRYWEILAAIPATAESDWARAFESIPNLRLLRMRPGLGHYRVRAVLATEAIGDVVTLTSIEEAAFLDIPQMILNAHGKNTIVIGDRGKGSALDVLLGIVGNGSGFRVNARFMQTMACPRNILTRLLHQPEQQLALRFPPNDSAIPLATQAASEAFRLQAPRRHLRGRLVLAHRLTVSSAPNVLLALSIISFLTSIGGALFLAYVTAVWLFKPDVQPGWATTSGILAVSAGFLGLLGLGLATGIQKVIDLLGSSETDDILEEIGQINIYAGLSEDLNVYYERGSVPQIPDPPQELRHEPL